MSRRTPPRRPRVDKTNPSWIRLVPVALLIVVGGLVIGALISRTVASNREVLPSVVIAPTPGPPDTTAAPHDRRPVIVATIVARVTPSPAPTDVPTPSPEPATSPDAEKQSAKPTGKPNEKPTPEPTDTAPTERPSPSPRPSPSHRRAAAIPLPPVPKRSAAPVSTSTPAVVAHTTATPAATAEPAAGPATPAVGAVRRYLDALRRGDEAAAYAALGGSSGDKGLSLSEQAFVDRNAHITNIRTTPSQDGSETVEVEIASAKGNYFSTFHVVQNAKGYVIDQHDFIKP